MGNIEKREPAAFASRERDAGRLPAKGTLSLEEEGGAQLPVTALAGVR